MRKINVGCGGNRLSGWENHDRDLDITLRLPYEDASIDYVFAEHVVEHVTSGEAYRFFEECFRVLRKGGILRVAVPDIERMMKMSGTSAAWKGYQLWIHIEFHVNPVKNIATLHGHKSLWTAKTLMIVLAATGFDVSMHDPGDSDDAELKGVEGHGKVIGDVNNYIETSVVEAKKN